MGRHRLGRRHRRAQRGPRPSSPPRGPAPRPRRGSAFRAGRRASRAVVASLAAERQSFDAWRRGRRVSRQAASLALGDWPPTELARVKNVRAGRVSTNDYFQERKELYACLEWAKRQKWRLLVFYTASSARPRRPFFTTSAAAGILAYCTAALIQPLQREPFDNPSLNTSKCRRQSDQPSVPGRLRYRYGQNWLSSWRPRFGKFELRKRGAAQRRA